jgi:uncharacterized cupredoxin-like copper-binding protein
MMDGTGMMMRIAVSPNTIREGKVTFIVTNYGQLNHELLVFPAPADGIGARPVAADGRINEAQRLGEASRTCGEGAENGITPGARSWVTLTLGRGNYELLCNIPWHYANGMFTGLRVL